MNWNDLFRISSNAYHSLLVMMMISVTAIVTYLCKIKKQPTDNIYLVLHATCSLVQVFAFSFAVLLLERGTQLRKDILDYSSYLFLIIELILCSLFIRTHLKNTKIKFIFLVETICGVLLLLMHGVLFFPKGRDFMFPSLTSTLIITIASLYYFLQLFIEDSAKDLFSQNSFWAISGMLIFFSVIAPTCLLLNYLKVTLHYPLGNLVFINNVAYSILFTTYIIAIWRQVYPKY